MIYIHVPFCKRRCIYCDFYSTTYGKEVRSRYVAALFRELKARHNYLPYGHIKTIYFGGGTPSQLTISEIQGIMNCINENYDLAPTAEITFEANPDDTTPDYVRQLVNCGINRVSLGVQTFDDNLLRVLQRRHSAAEACNAVRVLKAEGIQNISIDLMYGLPQQSLDMFSHDLETAFALPITHLSAYALTIEEGTILDKMILAKMLQPVDEETYIAEYELLMQRARNAGFTHYEISNFALPDYYSRHNSAYWNGTPYLGCGPGAHSYNGISRQYNLPDVMKYITHTIDVPHITEKLSREAQFNEQVFTALRTQKGLDLIQLNHEFGEEWCNEMLESARKHLKAGRLSKANEHLTLTPSGIFVSDDVMSDLMR